MKIPSPQSVVFCSNTTAFLLLPSRTFIMTANFPFRIVTGTVQQSGVWRNEVAAWWIWAVPFGPDEHDEWNWGWLSKSGNRVMNSNSTYIYIHSLLLITVHFWLNLDEKLVRCMLVWIRHLIGLQPFVDGMDLSQKRWLCDCSFSRKQCISAHWIKILNDLSSLTPFTHMHYSVYVCS